MIRNLHRSLRIFIRWAIISALTSALLFVAAGSTRVISLRLYLIAFSAMLLVTMFAVGPQLAHERAHPGQEAGRAQLRFAAGFYFLLTLTVASFCVGHLHSGPAIPSWLLSTALFIFVASGSLQLWAMVTNPFFSPVVRIQNERGHRLIDSGPYRFIRHPVTSQCVFPFLQVR